MNKFFFSFAHAVISFVCAISHGSVFQNKRLDANLSHFFEIFYLHNFIFINPEPEFFW